MIATERVLDGEPFTVRRRVRFGDCDPAGVVYTVRFSDYVVSAMDLFLKHVVGGSLARSFPGVDTPIKALSFVFSAPLRPDDEFDMTVLIGELRTSTFELSIVARGLDGERIFESTVVPICIAAAERRALDIPAALREDLVLYRHRTGAADGASIPH